MNEKITTIVLNYAGFWRRAGASFIDAILLMILGKILEVVLIGNIDDYFIEDPEFIMWGSLLWSFSVYFLSTTILGWLYFALMESSDKQGTLGKMAFNIKVTDLNGNKISFGRATGRTFGKYLSSIILGVGYLMAAWTKRKQALNDMMADCLVIKN
jgi:uncharacterized RDD family membrane protein YckC